MKIRKKLKGKGLGVGTGKRFENEQSSMIHEQLARLVFAERKVEMNQKRILDFGCGTGYNCYYIAERNFPKEVVGINLLADCIEYARINYSAHNVKFYEQDCLEYNADLGTFDFILSCEVIEHIKDHNCL